MSSNFCSCKPVQIHPNSSHHFAPAGLLSYALASNFSNNESCVQVLVRETVHGVIVAVHRVYELIRNMHIRVLSLWRVDTRACRPPSRPRTPSPMSTPRISRVPSSQALARRLMLLLVLVLGLDIGGREARLHGAFSPLVNPLDRTTMLPASLFLPSRLERAILQQLLQFCDLRAQPILDLVHTRDF